MTSAGEKHNLLDSHASIVPCTTAARHTFNIPEEGSGKHLQRLIKGRVPYTFCVY